MPFTVLPPNPSITGLPVRVNLEERRSRYALKDGLDRVESVSSDAGEIRGAAMASGWAGSIRLKPGVRLGQGSPSRSR